MIKGPLSFDGNPPQNWSEFVHGGTRLFLDTDCEIDDNATILIGDGVICGHGVKVESHSQKQTEIGSYVWLGEHVVVRAGARIGEGAMVCAGTVVEGDVPPHAVLQGDPAQVVWYLR